MQAIPSPDCCGFFGSLFGHSFSPRYSQTKTAAYPPLDHDTIQMAMVNTPSDEYTEDVLAVLLNSGANTQSTYMGDVCQRCGAVVNDKPPVE